MIRSGAVLGDGEVASTVPMCWSMSGYSTSSVATRQRPKVNETSVPSGLQVGVSVWKVVMLLTGPPAAGTAERETM